MKVKSEFRWIKNAFRAGTVVESFSDVKESKDFRIWIALQYKFWVNTPRWLNLLPWWLSLLPWWLSLLPWWLNFHNFLRTKRNILIFNWMTIASSYKWLKTQLECSIELSWKFEFSSCSLNEWKFDVTLFIQTNKQKNTLTII